MQKKECLVLKDVINSYFVRVNVNHLTYVKIGIETHSVFEFS